MAVYEVSGRTTLTTATAAATLASIRAGGSGAQRPAIREIQIFTTNATAGGIGLARSTAVATGTLTSTSGVSRDVLETVPSTTTLVTAATTAMATNGGIGTVFRRWTHAGAQGSGIIWTFDLTSQINMTLNTSGTGEICIVNLNAATPSLYDVTVVFAE